MGLYDQHLHTWFSSDSDADPVLNVQQALAMGLAGLSMTDHYDSHPAEWPMCYYDYDRIAETLAAARARFGEQIFIGHGVEICFQPAEMARVLAFLESHGFDVVLLSVHWFKGRALHVREHWEGLDVAQATRLYLETVLDAAQFVLELKSQGRRPFDVLGHLDLVKRYTQRFFNAFEVRSQKELIDEILKKCLEADLVPEVNLSSLRQGLTEPMPAGWVVRRYAELGGEAMSLGSDAHSPEFVGACIQEGAALLKREGIGKLAVFKNRRRCDEDL